ncbi:hypothetical protein SAMN02745121_07476 [Nannocystis exedens]|uniref:Uncharacterized protein n=1 Tax=Nannocystis exedens TaxID=54 RepID=A0A1I2GRA0_9BACT|nr:hypothetical protein [Nannocystis exedens]PCC68782.1 hypothetical protein NAEX_01799 [Nannocystis exedens]SFF20002.1 hypothetical protein SAMN02745121_07476 [Nannocystis exedens]
MPRLSALFLALPLLGCGGPDKKDDPPENDDPPEKDLGGGADEGLDSEEELTTASACTATCLEAGFSSGEAKEYALEIYCYCSGRGSLNEAACSAMCMSLGWADSNTFNGDACNCYH